MRRLIFAVGLIGVLVCAVLATAGVLHVRNSENETSITLDKKDLQEKTQEAIDSAKETGGRILESTGKAMHKAGEGVRETSPEKSAPETKASPAPERKPQPATGAQEDTKVKKDISEGTRP